MVELCTPIEEAVELAVGCGHSRLPVFATDRDHVVGILYVKDLLQHWSQENRAGIEIESLMRPPFFVPETKHIGELLREFQTRKLHIAIVLDEYGGTAGLITIEDILEEIVGEIADEHAPAPPDLVQTVGDSQVEVDARIHVDEINARLEVSLPEDDGFETLGGFIVSHLGRIPAVGEEFDWANLRFTVIEADERRVHRLEIVGATEGASSPGD